MQGVLTGVAVVFGLVILNVVIQAAPELIVVVAGVVILRSMA